MIKMNEGRKEYSAVLLSFSAIQMIIIIVLFSVIIINKQDDTIGDTGDRRQPAITIRDLSSELPENPKEYIKLVEQDLAKTVEAHTSSFNLSEAIAEVRQDTLKVKKFEELNGYYFSAIIDVPVLRQSYQIYSFYPTENSAPNSFPSATMYVLCIDDRSLMIYQEFDCKDEYPQQIRSNILATYLYYFNFQQFSVSINSDDHSKIIINPIKMETSEQEQQKYLQQTKRAIDSLGISPESFEYNILTPEEQNYFIPAEYRY